MLIKIGRLPFARRGRISNTDCRRAGPLFLVPHNRTHIIITATTTTIATTTRIVDIRAVSRIVVVVFIIGRRILVSNGRRVR